MDLYGQEFSLNYRGGETFKTYHGALFSILVVVFVVNHTVVNLIRLINRKQPEVFAHEEPMEKETIEELGSYNLRENRFNVAFLFRQSGKIVELEKEYGEIKGYQINAETEIIEKQGKPIEMEKCTQKSFSKIEDAESFEDYSIGEGLCPGESENFAIGGKSKTKEFQQVVFTLVKADSSAKVNAWWNKTTISVVG